MINRRSNMAAFLLVASLAATTLPANTIDAFHVPSNRLCNRRSLSLLVNNYDKAISLSPFNIQYASQAAAAARRYSILYMAGEDDEQGQEDDDEEEDVPEEASSSTNDDDDDDQEEEEDDNTKTLNSYKSGLNALRLSTNTPRPGSTAPIPIDVTMKFGGSSLANSERVDRVANLIKDRIRPPLNEDGTVSDEVPVRPRAGELIVFCCRMFGCFFVSCVNLY